MKKALLLYGICGGLLIAALKFAEYRFLVVEHSIEIYGGLIAVVFALVGIWLGLTLTRTKEILVVREVPVPASPTFVRNDPKVAELGITPRENTVKTHASRLFSKLNVSRRTQAVDVAKRLGLIP